MLLGSPRVGRLRLELTRSIRQMCAAIGHSCKIQPHAMRVVAKKGGPPRDPWNEGNRSVSAAGRCFNLFCSAQMFALSSAPKDNLDPASKCPRLPLAAHKILSLESLVGVWSFFATLCNDTLGGGC